MIKKIFSIALLLAVSFTFHLESAKVIEKVGDFLRKKTKFGDVYLHK
jgi:hypothetical protein